MNRIFVFPWPLLLRGCNQYNYCHLLVEGKENLFSVIFCSVECSHLRFISSKPTPLMELQPTLPLFKAITNQSELHTEMEATVLYKVVGVGLEPFGGVNMIESESLSIAFPLPQTNDGTIAMVKFGVAELKGVI
jgi:hypothetical protein